MSHASYPLPPWGEKWGAFPILLLDKNERKERTIPTQDIIAKTEFIGKNQIVLCPTCSKDHCWKHGSYPRKLLVIPGGIGYPVRIPRYQCRNADCRRFTKTFSLRPFPLWSLVGCSLLLLLDLVLKLRGFTLLGLQNHFEGEVSVSTLHRWRKRGREILAWFKGTDILGEPGLAWVTLQHLHFRRFYPARAGP